VGKNLKIYSLLVYCVNFIFYCSALTLLTVGTILAYSVIQIEQQELKKKREGRENILFCIFGDEEQLEQELKRKRGGKKENIYKSAN
jgi:hypothetical protein